MLTIKRFTGIDNVGNPERLVYDKKTATSALAEAMNVDIGNDREILLRGGYTESSDVCHKNVWQGNGFMLATTDGGDLVSIVDGDETVLYPSLGVSRVWYSNWPDGRTAFSNTLINGVATASGATGWGVPIPGALAGSLSVVSGDLFAGSYRYALCYERISDGLTGGPLWSSAFNVTAAGGIVLTGLPTLAGYRIAVYLTSHNGGKAWKAGTTTGSTFTFTGKNNALNLPLLTEHVRPAPVGRLSCFWRGRALVAVGTTLYASKHMQPEAFVPADAFKTFSASITLLQPVDGGIFVGTEDELVFLAGQEWAKLSPRRMIDGPVVLGSGVTVPGKQLTRGDGTAGQHDCMVCIADRIITAGYPDGAITALTEGRYEVAQSVDEVAATFRLREGRIPQYIAIPQ